MTLVSFKQKNIVLDVVPGTTLSECIRMAKLSIETPCNCMGLCGKCIVKASGDLEEPTLEEKIFVNNEKGLRLACLAKVKGDVEVEFIKTSKALKTVNKGYSIEVEIDSEIKKVKLPKMDASKAIPYEETLHYKNIKLNLLEKIVKIQSDVPREIYGITYEDSLLDIDENIEKVLGIAIDIGTTGISAYLVNLETGDVLNKISCLNPQTEFGGDVLSRITYVINNENGTKVLRDTIVKRVSEIARELVIGADFDITSVYKIIIAANTTMLHLFAGINPKTIAKAPYRSLFLNKKDILACDIGIEINKNGIVTLLPSVSSYVGADILSGIAATDFHKKRHSSIFIDIGTNGEIVVNSNGKLAATSTAAGPALEGMNISCGCRAEEGAIDSFAINEDFTLSFTTIGNVIPKGICGSALIDIAAYMVKRGIILPSGKFNEKMSKAISCRLKDKKFYINEDIFISQKDIRQIQLAKGAIAAGVAMLLQELNISIEDVKEVVIAGAFGYHINPESIKTIGLISKGFKGDITFVGNSSVEGARLALINKDFIKTIESLKSEVEVVELSTKEKFQDYFVEALGF